MSWQPPPGWRCDECGAEHPDHCRCDRRCNRCGRRCEGVVCRQCRDASNAERRRDDYWRGGIDW